ncbi:hypothetical protein [Aliiglaciecola litoralis]|uniref:Lipoprotein n=1 Tax=Aliiglaciecola litoralis TaxID=582857 RepID=A0ABP3X6C3_9ALTE
MKYLYLVVLMLCLSACSHIESDAPLLDLDYAEEPLNLFEYVDSNWEKVCFLGPYSNDDAALELLGFQWPLETLTSVWVNEGVTLLVFIENGSIESYYEVSRGRYDFSVFSNSCIKRSAATFIKNGSKVVQTQV